MSFLLLGMAQVLRTLFGRRLSPFLALGSGLAAAGVGIQYSGAPAHDQIGGAILAVGAAALAVVFLEAIRVVEDQAGLLGDLHRLGIARIQERSEADQNVMEWYKRIRRAREVDLLGLVLRDRWAHSSEFRNALEEAVKSNRCQVRIITLCPDARNPVFRRRAHEEEDAGKGAAKRMLGSLEDSWEAFRALRDRLGRLDTSFSDCVKLRHAEDTTIYCHFIRVDDIMRISHYVSHQTGRGGAVSIEVRGSGSPTFRLYKDQFDHIFSRHSHEAPH